MSLEIVIAISLFSGVLLALFENRKFKKNISKFESHSAELELLNQRLELVLESDLVDAEEGESKSVDNSNQAAVKLIDLYSSVLFFEPQDLIYKLPISFITDLDNRLTNPYYSRHPHAERVMAVKLRRKIVGKVDTIESFKLNHVLNDSNMPRSKAVKSEGYFPSVLGYDCLGVA